MSSYCIIKCIRKLFIIIFVYIGLGYFIEFLSTPVFNHRILKQIVEDVLKEQQIENNLNNQNNNEIIDINNNSPLYNSPSPYNHSYHTIQLESIISKIHYSLYSHYPKHIIPPNHPNRRWLTNLAGGFKTQMYLFHGSISEYIMIWGTQLPTTGHSGRNWAEFHDFLISGHGEWWGEGSLSVTSASAGTYIYTEKFSGGIVHLSYNTFMLEYSHGAIPLLLPFGLADSLFSSLDPVTIGNSLYDYGKLVMKELLMNGKI